ncbi:Protein of unknown function DUF82 [Xenococcus sp. PCC 7305]|uniref:DUF5615 family PIN-like protein n=1 Tax=Xenococcus sp. PCC 7305 TaxID=102125 RepID=UPI0002ACF54B|nr:DUF5615 family PIN-like protein [Xenococcus sp. PCC 7305]ELS04551.1 Protein of unknown function DUF82 [Xenococcus sp. PCC 7305]
MKFLVDAQLPIRLAKFLQASGYDTLHTRDLPQQNATSDSQINDISIQQERIVITKDSDFAPEYIYFLAFRDVPTLQAQFREWGYITKSKTQLSRA